eukprot:GEMP01103039.1.p1 GENE.GEMP01103039.1~~GEMP01103039.1.p1  ORF type:complete len:156 (+),score=38.71 GEMP01103039.1:60-527(+)
MGFFLQITNDIGTSIFTHCWKYPKPSFATGTLFHALEANARAAGCDIPLLRADDAFVSLRRFGDGSDLQVVCLLLAWPGGAIEDIEDWAWSMCAKIHRALQLVTAKFLAPVVALWLGQHEGGIDVREEASLVLGPLWGALELNDTQLALWDKNSH